MFAPVWIVLICLGAEDVSRSEIPAFLELIPGPRREIVRDRLAALSAATDDVEFHKLLTCQLRVLSKFVDPSRGCLETDLVDGLGRLYAELLPRLDELLGPIPLADKDKQLLWSELVDDIRHDLRRHEPVGELQPYYRGEWSTDLERSLRQSIEEWMTLFAASADQSVFRMNLTTDAHEQRVAIWKNFLRSCAYQILLEPNKIVIDQMIDAELKTFDQNLPAAPATSTAKDPENNKPDNPIASVGAVLPDSGRQAQEHVVAWICTLAPFLLQSSPSDPKADCRDVETIIRDAESTVPAVRILSRIIRSGENWGIYVAGVEAAGGAASPEQRLARQCFLLNTSTLECRRLTLPDGVIRFEEEEIRIDPSRCLRSASPYNDGDIAQFLTWFCRLSRQLSGHPSLGNAPSVSADPFGLGVPVQAIQEPNETWRIFSNWPNGQENFSFKGSSDFQSLRMTLSPRVVTALVGFDLKKVSSPFEAPLPWVLFPGGLRVRFEADEGNSGQAQSEAQTPLGLSILTRVLRQQELQSSDESPYAGLRRSIDNHPIQVVQGIVSDYLSLASNDTTRNQSAELARLDGRLRQVIVDGSRLTSLARFNAGDILLGVSHRMGRTTQMIEEFSRQSQLMAADPSFLAQYQQFYIESVWNQVPCVWHCYREFTASGRFLPQGLVHHRHSDLPRLAKRRSLDRSLLHDVKEIVSDRVQAMPIDPDLRGAIHELFDSLWSLDPDFQHVDEFSAEELIRLISSMAPAHARTNRFDLMRRAITLRWQVFHVIKAYWYPLSDGDIAIREADLHQIEQTLNDHLKNSLDSLQLPEKYRRHCEVIAGNGIDLLRRELRSPANPFAYYPLTRISARKCLDQFDASVGHEFARMRGILKATRSVLLSQAALRSRRVKDVNFFFGSTFHQEILRQAQTAIDQSISRLVGDYCNNLRNYELDDAALHPFGPLDRVEVLYTSRGGIGVGVTTRLQEVGSMPCQPVP